MKEVLKYFDLDNIKNNKSYFVARIIYSILIALSFFLDSLLSFGAPDNETYRDVYFREVKIQNIIILIMACVITFFIISAIGNFYEYFEEKKSKTEKNNKRNSKKVFLISFIVILVCWLPVILSYVPGGIFDDTVDAIYGARGIRTLSKNQSLLYMYIMRFFMFVGESIFGDLNIGLVIYSITQALLFILVLSTIITWLYDSGVDKKAIAVLVGFVGLFKLFPIYSTAIWKDSLFAIAMTFFTYLICKIWYSEGEEIKKPFLIVEYVFISLIISFLRNNGQYIIIGTSVILGIYYWKKINKSILKLMIPVTIEIIIVGIIQGPIMSALNRKCDFRESVGIPIQQICYVIAHDGNINEEQLEFINKIESIENIKERYVPYNVDYIKFHEFNEEFLEANEKEFIKVWGELGIQNPKMYVKAYLLSTTGYWNISRISKDWRYYKNYFYLESYPTYVIDWLWQVDLIKQATGNSIKSYILPKRLIPCAIFEVILFLSIVYMIKNKRYSNIIMLVPVLILLATLLVATPIAFSMRYMFSIVVIMPFSLFFPVLESEKKKEEKKKQKN